MKPVKGMLLGFFGPAGKANASVNPTHVLMVNLDYKAENVTTVIGPGNLEVFDAATHTWLPVAANQAKLQLPPGGGKLVRTQASQNIPAK